MRAPSSESPVQARAWGRRAAIAAAVALCFGSAVIPLSAAAAGPASVTPPAPTVSRFAATPGTIRGPHGLVRLSAVVANATDCVFSSSQKLVGLPNQMPCTHGAVSATVALPHNRSHERRTYRFELTVIQRPPVTSSPRVGHTITIHSQVASVTVLPGGGSSPLHSVKSLVGNGFAFCALLTTGTVSCWGLNQWGFLGTESGSALGAAAAPVAAVGGIGKLTGVTSIAASEFGGFCAIVALGAVDCWGFDLQGELGDGVMVLSTNVPHAVLGVGGVGKLKGVASLASSANGGYCALLTSGRVDCWGYGTSGELGDGLLAHSAVPMAVQTSPFAPLPLTDVSSLASDGGGYCALLNSNHVMCWGDNTTGELGVGATAATLPNSPYALVVHGIFNVGDLSGAVQLVSVGTAGSGGGGYCTRMGNGTVACWGYNGVGELGDGTTTTRTSPVNVLNNGPGILSGTSGLASNGDAGYCVRIGVGVDCWGYNQNGELGDGSLTDRHSPVVVQQVNCAGCGPLGGVARVVGPPQDNTGIVASSGYCVVLTTQKADCWGINDHGSLGDGANAQTTVPQVVVDVGGAAGSTLGGIQDLVGQDSGEGYCALLTSATVDCWGDNFSGTLGDGASGTSTSSTSSVHVLSF